jgi:threonine dehydratase
LSNRTIDREGIAATYATIAPFVRRTPTLDVNLADFGGPDVPVTLKLEQLQHAGSFKTRGAFANLLLRDVPKVGVAAASGGNHGAAVAYAAMIRNVPASIFIPSISSPAKLARIAAYGARAVVGGDRYADALAASQEWIATSGAMAVHAFDQVETILGAGSLGLEIEEQVPGVTTVLAAVGGGGLIGGIASWFGGRARIVGVEPDGAPTLAYAMRAGHPIDAPAGSIAADSLAPRQIGALTFPIAQRYVDPVVLVSDDDIANAQAALWRGATLAVEPGGAAAFAALLSGVYRAAPGERICVVLSGGNRDIS